MDPTTALVARVRDHYVEQFRVFADERRAISPQGVCELKLRLNGRSELFNGLFCVDFIEGEPPEILEFEPDRVLEFDPIVGEFGAASVSIHRLHWNDALVHHDLDHVPMDDLAQWFRRWFDSEDERSGAPAELSGVIHSMAIQPRSISIDMGTAAPEAFWEILQLLERAGAKQIEVTTSRPV